jgi:predicted unusual protein kinase regulating ubiquinone biosynthesis (AarF/ABC1/UbiB family)
MGGVLIKVGQFMSTRLDVLPRDITAELSALQDEVGAESFEDIRGVVEAEFGMPLDGKFIAFDPEPIASASIGQAHRARLCVTTKEGEPCPPVVVKVQRPNIAAIIEADLAALRYAARWLDRSRTVRKHLNVPALLEEFARTLSEETDYLREGANAERFARAFAGQPDVRVPAVVWSHTTRRVLTLEDVGAIKIMDTAALEAAGVARRGVAERLMATYLKQVFEDGFFHADPHPGNLFVLPTPRPGDAGAFRLVFVDFGMTGILEPATFAGLKEALLAIGTKDGARLVAAFRTLGVLLPGADLKLIERASQKVLERVWGRSAAELMRMGPEEFSGLAEEFSGLLYEMPFQLPENMILLGRCLGILSGMATGLDPDFNAWSTLTPYITKLVQADGIGPFRTILREAGTFVSSVAALPKRMGALLDRIDDGRLDVRLPELKHEVGRLERGLRRLAGSVVFAAVLLAGTAVYLGGHAEVALGFGAADGLLLLWLLFGR